MRPLRVLDLMSGSGGWSDPIREAGHLVTTLDIDPKCGADHVRDILSVRDLRELERDGRPFDLIVASPDCTVFSVASIGTHWGGGRRAYIPITRKAVIGLRVWRHTFKLVRNYRRDRNPRVLFVIENPRCVSRQLAPYPPTTTEWWCHFGDMAAKPTDLWTNIEGVWRGPCHNRRAGHSTECCCTDHAPAPRGSRTPGSTQGKNGAAIRGRIPREMSIAVMRAAERHVGLI